MIETPNQDDMQPVRGSGSFRRFGALLVLGLVVISCVGVVFAIRTELTRHDGRWVFSPALVLTEGGGVTHGIDIGALKPEHVLADLESRGTRGKLERSLRDVLRTGELDLEGELLGSFTVRAGDEPDDPTRFLFSWSVKEPAIRYRSFAIAEGLQTLECTMIERSEAPPFPRFKEVLSRADELGLDSARIVLRHVRELKRSTGKRKTP